MILEPPKMQDRKLPKIPNPVNGKDLGPLPQGWEIAQTESGDYYFIE